MLLLLLSVAACTPDPTDKPDQPGGDGPVCVPFPLPVNEVDLEPAFPDLPAFEQPVMLTRAGDTWYLIQRTGQLYRFQADDAAPELVLDLSSRVDAIMDAGMSGIALHPDFATNGTFFLFYSTSDTAVLGDGSGAWRSRLSRFVLSDLAEETVILEVEQPEDSHIHANDDLHFGPDGLLYLSLGDGGPQGDDHGHAQDLGALQGKLLRIDVDGAGEGLAYNIPADNPFVGVAGARPEVWAYGLRNPWRFSIEADGTVWVGDVGHDGWEEINRVAAGDNLGWPIKEGPECYEADTCDETGLVEPVVAHDHYAARSITGGLPYRGDAVATLRDEYVYADYKYGQIWSFGADRVPRVVNGDGHGFSSFTEDADGELLAVDVMDGGVYRLVAGESPRGEDGQPVLLSETGCVDPDAPAEKAGAFYNYAINVPFWSDGAEKDRWLAVPEGGAFEVGEDGDIELPEGSVLIKDFRLGDDLVETRILAYHGSDRWTSLSYQWDAEQTDATLVPFGESSVTATWPAGEWTHPSRGMCRDCHSRAAGGSLGLELAQLDRAATDPRLGDDQLAGFVGLGLLEEVPAVTPFPALDDTTAPLDVRARAFLHVNCSYCHRPNGRGRGDQDLRFELPIAETGTCDERPSLGSFDIDGARIIAPGHPERSVLLTRLSIVGDDAMPPIGRAVVDEEAVALISAWIAAMPEDPGDCELP